MRLLFLVVLAAFASVNSQSCKSTQVYRLPKVEKMKHCNAYSDSTCCSPSAAKRLVKLRTLLFLLAQYFSLLFPLSFYFLRLARSYHRFLITPSLPTYSRGMMWVAADDGCGIVEGECFSLLADFACASSCSPKLVVTDINYPLYDQNSMVSTENECKNRSYWCGCKW
jgi:hypothetical protein